VKSRAEKSKSGYRRERFSGGFRRVITLPEDVDPDKVRASYRDGVLHVMIDRREEVKPRRIEVLTLKVPKRPELQPRKIQISFG